MSSDMDLPVSAELEGLVTLRSLAGNTDDLVGLESLGEEDSEMTETGQVYQYAETEKRIKEEHTLQHRQFRPSCPVHSRWP